MVTLTNSRPTSEDSRYREIFDAVPVALWLEDFSRAADLLDDIRKEGVSDIRAFFHAHPDRLAEVIAGVRVLEVNARSLEIFEAERKEGLSRSLSEVFLPETSDIFIEQLAALWDGRRRFSGEVALQTLKGRRIDVAFTIVFNGERLERTLASITDITARKRAELLARKHDEIAQLYSAIVEFSDDAILTKNLDAIITSWNRGAQRLFGYTAEEAIGRSVTMLIPADRQDEEPDILSRIRAGERIDHYETIRQRKDGSHLHISLTVSPLKDGAGQIVGASKIARDITERKRAQEQQQLLMREMNHRIKNLFALAGSVVNLSARNAETPEAFKEKVLSRLQALSQAHALTMTQDPTQAGGASATVSLHALIRAILLPYEGEAGTPRVKVAGDNLDMLSTSTTAFALLLHEFATNAAKYGALSSPNGYLEIGCGVGEGRLEITWVEKGGPAIERQGIIEGFGSVLTRVSAQSLGGSITHKWNPEGVAIILDCDLERICPSDAGQPA
jgi:PAS domain S-box-containing protein